MIPPGWNFDSFRNMGKITNTMKTIVVTNNIFKNSIAIFFFRRNKIESITPQQDRTKVMPAQIGIFVNSNDLDISAII